MEGETGTAREEERDRKMKMEDTGRLREKKREREAWGDSRNPPKKDIPTVFS